MIARIVAGTLIAASVATMCATNAPQSVEEPEKAPQARVEVKEIEMEDAKPFNLPLESPLQRFIIHLGEETGVDPKIILALIYVESSYNADSIGDDGRSFGLMQVQRRWHEERIERLNVIDLLNPYDNVKVGIDYLSELYEKYGDIEMALVAYNAGPTGAWEHWFSKGIYTSDYSRKVMEAAENIKEG